ncbi:MAG: plasmid recombination protein, partial [Oscillospiraceae bacterium]|nr:plasmid recombination protein [Oscillospiraceae bacterium]
MNKEIKAMSVSFRSDDGCIEHNNRDFFSDNVDKMRTPNNITYIKRDLRELYHELFDTALAEYNAKQKRADRQIPDYYEHIRKGKKEKMFQEIIVMFGNSDTCGVGSENWDTAVKLLDEYMRDFEKRNPNLKVFNAVMHLDEATPHLHIDFVPVCYGQKQGLSTRVSMKRAIQQMGFTAKGKKETEAILWGSSERARLTEILNGRGISRQVVGAYHDHKSVEEYKRYAQILGNTQAHINALKKKNPVDLSSDEVGEILNQNDVLREKITGQKAELAKLKAMTSAKFVPIEVFSDEKRQYIIEKLTQADCPFVEERNTIYVPEYYEQSVKKIAAAYKETDMPNIRERLKFFIDRILYSAQNFEHFIKLLETNKYEVRRGKYIAVKPPYGKRFMRLKSLGEDYSEYSLKKRIEGRNDIPNEFADYENRANELQKPFYYAINTSITLIRKFHITPTKHNPNEPYSFLNDHSIENMVSCLNTLSEFRIDTREQLYAVSSDLQKQLDSNNSD